MASDFIGGGLPDAAPSAASHTDPTPPAATTGEAPPPITKLETPASNPGADDPTGGIAKDAGGASSTAQIGSPVSEEHGDKQTVVGAVLESVFGKKERTAEETDASTAATGNATAMSSTTGEEQATGTGAAGVLGTVAGAAAAGTAAVAGYVGLSNNETTPKEEGDKTAAAVEKSTAETTEAAKETANNTAEAAKETANDTAAAVNEKTAEATGGAKEESAEKDETAEDGEEHKSKKVSDHEAAKRENEDAIPTAGGEKLGEAHKGESKVVPDVPPKNAEADETKPGQPDKATADNTAKNAGDAPAGDAATPKKRSSMLGHKRDASESGKPKFFDRVKAKLHLDKKDKA